MKRPWIVLASCLINRGVSLVSIIKKRREINFLLLPIILLWGNIDKKRK
jgi:hypothetical protein